MYLLSELFQKKIILKCNATSLNNVDKASNIANLIIINNYMN